MEVDVSQYKILMLSCVFLIVERTDKIIIIISTTLYVTEIAHFLPQSIIQPTLHIIYVIKHEDYENNEKS